MRISLEWPGKILDLGSMKLLATFTAMAAWAKPVAIRFSEMLPPGSTMSPAA